MTSSESRATESVRSEEFPESGAEPTMMHVRSEGLKLDLVLLENRVSGLTIDYQNISESGELQKWIGIVDGVIFGSAPLSGGSILQILGQAAGPPASHPRHLTGPEEDLQEQAEPTMMHVRSEGLKLDLVLLENRVSGLTIDYQNISESGELQKWIGIIKGMISQSVSSPEGSIHQTLSEATNPPITQPEPPKEEQLESPAEKEVREEPLEKHDYHKVVLHAVDVSLDTLGSAGKQAVLSLLENRYGLSERDIPDHPRGFVVLLDELLGPSAQILETEIISNIRLVWAAPGDNLKAVVESLKERYQTTAPLEAAAQDLKSLAADFSPVAIATAEEQEGHSDVGMRNPGAPDGKSPVRPSIMDPIPVRFKYNATYPRHRD